MLFFEHIFPYISVAIFFFGAAYKLFRWFTTPSPFPLTVFPAPGNRSDRSLFFLKEVLFFNSLYRHSRLLWLLSWVMHLSLGLIIIGHITGIYFLGKQFTTLGMSPGASLALSNSLGMVTGVIFLISLTGLTAHRLFYAEARVTSDLTNYFELALLAGIAVTGTFLRLSITAPDLELIRDYITSLLFFHPAAIPAIPWFFWHFILFNALIIYLPYSKLGHWLGGWIIRLMLTEPPPEYPTPAGKLPRSSFAAPVNNDIQSPKSTTTMR